MRITQTQTKEFYKENGIWYIDLPEFLESGLGTKANLMMVNGADDFLDLVSGQGDEVTLEFGIAAFEGMTHTLKADKLGMDKDLLDRIGHAPVSYGMYYTVKELNYFRLWLCPVTEYVFGGGYPKEIYVRV